MGGRGRHALTLVSPEKNPEKDLDLNASFSHLLFFPVNAVSPEKKRKVVVDRIFWDFKRAVNCRSGFLLRDLGIEVISREKKFPKKVFWIASCRVQFREIFFSLPPFNSPLVWETRGREKRPFFPLSPCQEKRGASAEKERRKRGERGSGEAKLIKSGKEGYFGSSEEIGSKSWLHLLTPIPPFLYSTTFFPGRPSPVSPYKLSTLEEGYPY